MPVDENHPIIRQLDVHLYQSINTQPSGPTDIDSKLAPNGVSTKLRKNSQPSIFTSKLVANTTEESDNGHISCNLSEVTVSSETSLLPRYQPMVDAMYLGSFVKGNSVLSGAFSSYPLPAGAQKQPCSVFTNQIGTSSIDGVSLDPASIHDAVSNIMNGLEITEFSEMIDFVSFHAAVEVEVKYSLGAYAGIPSEILAQIGVPADIGFDTAMNAATAYGLSVDSTLTSMTLSGFTVQLGIADPTEMYEPRNATIDPGALYVSSITYGRKIFVVAVFTDQNFQSKVESSAAIEAILSADGAELGIQGSLDSEINLALQTGAMVLRISTVGASGPISLGTITSTNSLKTAIADVYRDKSANSMAPISYTLSYLDGSGLASVETVAKVLKPRCCRVARFYEVTIDSIEARKVVDFGLRPTEDIYGTIRIEANYIDSNGLRQSVNPTENGSVVFRKSSSQLVLLEEGDVYEINESRIFEVPLENQDSFRIEIETELRDKFVGFETDGSGASSVGYQGSKTINIVDVGYEDASTIICNEENSSAKLVVHYQIKPV